MENYVSVFVGILWDLTWYFKNIAARRLKIDTGVKTPLISDIKKKPYVLISAFYIRVKLLALSPLNLTSLLLSF